MPIYLLHHVNDSCQLKCKHCFLSNDSQNELATNKFDNYLNNFGKGIIFVGISGGEPFLRDDIADIVKKYHTLSGVEAIRIITNGFLTEKVLAGVNEILKFYDKRLTLEISIDGSKKMHDSIRGVIGSYDRAISTFRKLAEIEKKYPNFSRNINITVSAANQDVVLQLYRNLKEKENIQNISITLTRGRTNVPGMTKVNPKLYREISEEIENDILNRRLKGYTSFFGLLVNCQNILARKDVIKTIEDGKVTKKCYAGKLSGVIYSDGSMCACEPLNEKISSIQSTKADIHWRNWKIPKRNCSCTHECFLTVNILFNIYMWPQMFFLMLKMVLLDIVRFAFNVKTNWNDEVKRQNIQKKYWINS